MIAGYLFIAALPRRMADRAFDRLARYQQSKFDARIDRDIIMERLRVFLDGIRSEKEIRECAEQYYAWHTEDLWARWQASHTSKWPVRTEVVGLDHVTHALEQGRGVVFWGMSFCGTLFCKIALSSVGVALTQLSAADHGTWSPLTWWGRRVVGPMHCLPEGRYLAERIRIPVEGGNNYLYRLGRTLKNKGCVWIAGERTGAKKVVTANFLGRPGRFPVGAPTLALRHNAALLPVYTERLGRFHYRVTIEAPIYLKEDLGRDEMINEAVQDYAQRLNDRVHKNLGEWAWNGAWAESMLSNRRED